MHLLLQVLPQQQSLLQLAFLTAGLEPRLCLQASASWGLLLPISPPFSMRQRDVNVVFED